ncbi:MAG: signal recognition particle-docking protein FtsY, partial [Acidiferrobacteraceae bacterium]|nr:signal recognition particle-docking protein FtsY [Acidiferrobacteraceae bacterium]
AVFEALEDQLIMADLGVAASGEAVAALRRHAASKRIENLPALKNLLSHELAAMLGKAQRSIDIQSQPGTPFVILMVGVNGVGKTTTAAKLAAFFRRSERSVMLAACDTFRAAAIEQLQTWGERLELPVIAQAHGADAAAVAHDAMKAAQARKIDVLIVDSAGRQHVNVDLMAQLRKIKRVIRAVDVAAPQETLLVVDGGTGQNALAQVAAFGDAVEPTGVCVTKLDGTARGGIVVALARQCALTIPFIGVGETLEDLQPFDADRFARALVGIDS